MTLQTLSVKLQKRLQRCPLPTPGVSRKAYEQRPFYANKAKTEMRQKKHYYKTRYTAVKRDRIKNPRHGQHPERDQNEIQICIIWGHQGTRQGSMPGYSRIFLAGVPDALKHFKNEIHDWKSRLAWILLSNFRRCSYGWAGCEHQCSTYKQHMHEAPHCNSPEPCVLRERGEIQEVKSERQWHTTVQFARLWLWAVPSENCLSTTLIFASAVLELRVHNTVQNSQQARCVGRCLWTHRSKTHVGILSSTWLDRGICGRHVLYPLRTCIRFGFAARSAISSPPSPRQQRGFFVAGGGFAYCERVRYLKSMRQ